jgi:mannosyltransferase PIG-V
VKPVPRWARWLDAATIVLLALAVKVALSHSVRFSLADHALTIREAWRPALAALALVALRHWRLPRPSLFDRAVAAWRRWRAEPRASILRVWAVSRGGVLVAGLIAAIVIGPPSPDSQRISDDPILDLPSRFDTTWYSGIAREGYRYDPHAGPQVQQTIAFFPAYPLAMRLAAAFTEPERQPNMTLRRYHELRASYLAWGGVAISIACFLGALLLFHEWVERHGGPDAAAASVLLLSAYPFAVFYSAAYTESVFLLGSVGACLAFERERWGSAALFGLLVGLTRPNGCLLSLTLAVLACAPLLEADRKLSPSQLVLRLSVAAMPGIGMLLYSSYVYTLAGDPLAWMKVQQAWGRNFETTMSYVRWTVRALSEQGIFFWLKAAPLEIVQTAALLFGLAMVWPVWRRLGAAYAVFLLASLLPPLFKGGVLSMGRMTSTLFPMFAVLAMAIPPHRREVWLLLFALGQGFVAVLFFTWRPLY